MSESPESLFNLMMKLSPEKLEAIKRDIINAVEDERASSATTYKGSSSVTEANEAEAAVVEDEQPLPPAVMNDGIEIDTGADMDIEVADEADPLLKAADPDDDWVDVFDYVREQASGGVSPGSVTPQIDIPLRPPAESTDKIAEASEMIHKRKSDETTKVFKKECVNPGCLGGSDEFLESPLFAMTFYYVSQKPNKIQYICSLCHDTAIFKFEEMGWQLMNNKPIHHVQIPKRHEIIEVIDSDQEDEQNAPIPDSQKIRFDSSDELRVEEILVDISKRVKINQQLKWIRDDLESRCDELGREQQEFERNMKMLQMKSATMYNEIYSINKTRIEHLEPLIITHNTSSAQISNTRDI